MIHGQSKYLISTEPLSYTNGATASLVIDTKGALTGTADVSAAEYLAIDVGIARTNSATNVPSTFKLQEADSNSATNYGDVAGSSFTSTVTTQSTTAGNNYTWFVDLRGRKRYIKAVIVPITTQVVQVTANLTRNHISPVTGIAANQGLSAIPLVL